MRFKMTYKRLNNMASISKKNNAEEALKEADKTIMQISRLANCCGVIQDKKLHSMIAELKLMSCKIQGHLDTRLESFCNPLSEIAADGR